MTELSATMAKLSGIKKSIVSVLNENISRIQSGGAVQTRSTFHPELVGHYFSQAAIHLENLKTLLPELFGDFQSFSQSPATQMSTKPSEEPLFHFSRSQLERLIRDIDQIFEIRANSELGQPAQEPERRVFISHGRSNDWRNVQAFIEKDVELMTLELAQQPNAGKTIIEKLMDSSILCTSAVIVMTGDDLANQTEARVRENVMHEIGYFQGRYGRSNVVLLHEEGVNIPTNLSGVAYIPFPKGSIEAGFHVLHRELKAIYTHSVLNLGVQV